jgi:hypothetical protein
LLTSALAIVIGVVSVLVVCPCFFALRACGHCGSSKRTFGFCGGEERTEAEGVLCCCCCFRLIVDCFLGCWLNVCLTTTDVDAYSPRDVWIARCGTIGVVFMVLVAFIVAQGM